MNTHLHIRHKTRFAINPDTKAVYPVSFDERGSKNLRADWLKLEQADLAACASTDVWPSVYFTHLHAALISKAVPARART
eukprot:3281691-Prymnesium_polylepis.1